MEKGVKLGEYEDRLVTRMGAWFPGERVVFRGLDLHRDFADADWMELYVYSFTGRRYPRPQLEMLHTLWVISSVHGICEHGMGHRRRRWYRFGEAEDPRGLHYR